jgi:hypothetical protein
MTPRKVRIAADSADERDKKEQTHHGGTRRHSAA